MDPDPDPVDPSLIGRLDLDGSVNSDTDLDGSVNSDTDPVPVSDPVLDPYYLSRFKEI